MTGAAFLVISGVPDPGARGHRWSADHAPVHARAWEQGGWTEPNWAEHTEGITLWSGFPFPLDGLPPHEPAGPRLRALWENDGIRCTDRLRGLYALAHLRADGSGAVFGDPVALRYVYYGSANGRFAVGSDARAVAEALAPPGARPAWDPFHACAIATATYRLPGTTGYQGVKVLEPSSWVSFAAGSGAATVHRPEPAWLQSEDLDAAGPDELIALIEEELRSGIRALAPSHADTVELTGGKDSRLVLALLMGTTGTDHLKFETAGLPGLGDVQVAERIAADFGLEHTRVFATSNVEGLPYETVFDRFVARTGGMVNGWDARPLITAAGGLRVSGLKGESLRSHNAIPLKADAAAREAFIERAVPTSALGLARPEYAQALAESFAAALQAVRELTTKPHDVLDTYLLRVRTQRYGPLDEIQPTRRFLPLYAPRAMRASFALGGERRHAQFVHFELINRVSPELARVPFAGKAWPEDLRAFTDQFPEPPPAPRASDAPAPSAQPLMASLHAELHPDRRAVLEDALADSTNPAWDLLDRQTAIDALGRYGELRVNQRKELFGALTSVRWLASGTRELPDL